MVKGSASEVLVGLATKVPVGGLIQPRFESQSLNGEPDLIAARGIVRGVVADDTPFAAFRVMRDIARLKLPGGGFGGAVSAHWDETAAKHFKGASEHAKFAVFKYAAEHDGIVGHLHSVEDDTFEPQREIFGPTGVRSQSPVRVLDSRELTVNELCDYFGKGLEDLADPLANAEIERDLRLIYASGVLTLASMAAELR